MIYLNARIISVYDEYKRNIIDVAAGFCKIAINPNTILSFYQSENHESVLIAVQNLERCITLYEINLSFEEFAALYEKEMEKTKPN
jgi:hypothetical protein